MNQCGGDGIRGGRKRDKKEKTTNMGKKTKSIWSSLRRSLHCESEPTDVHHPKKQTQINKTHPRSISATCSKSISNLRDVIHGSRTNLILNSFQMNAPGSSPISISSADFLNPISHEVVLSNSNCEIKITTTQTSNNRTTSSSFLGTLTPGTPGPSGPRPPPSAISIQKIKHGCQPSSIIACRKCGEHFGRWGAAETHHLSLHAVTEMDAGGSSRRIVEMICREGWGTRGASMGVERVLKIHNMQRTVAGFEEYRETVKAKAGRMVKKHHPRCIADGNELLRFHGSSVSCSLGEGGRSSVCFADGCRVCRIIENGFSLGRGGSGGEGVFTASTCGRALEREEGERSGGRKAVMVCRVIAGRVQRPLERREDMGWWQSQSQSGFDSVVGKVGAYSSVGMEELYVLNQRGVLPCFVVICTL